MIILELLFTLIVSFLFIKVLIKFSLFLGLQDIPNDRSIHSQIIPRGAGIGFCLSFFLTFVIFEFSFFLKYYFLFFSIFLVFLIGILDDYKEATPKAKFYIIFISCIILFYNDIYISSLGTYWGVNISLGYLALPFTMFAVAGFTNALNLIDGLDGLAASLSIIILSTFSFIGYTFNDNLIFIISIVLVFSLISFLFFNWQPAKIFMGDSGSLMLGFTISIVAIMSLKYIHPIVIIYLTAIPIIDTVVVMIRRIRRGQSPFKPDKTHIHHILYVFLAKNTLKTVVFLSLIQLMFCFFGYISARHIELYPKGIVAFSMMLGFFIIVLLAYMFFSGMIRRQRLIERLSQRRNKKR